MNKRRIHKISNASKIEQSHAQQTASYVKLIDKIKELLKVNPLNLFGKTARKT